MGRRRQGGQAGLAWLPDWSLVGLGSGLAGWAALGCLAELAGWAWDTKVLILDKRVVGIH